MPNHMEAIIAAQRKGNLTELVIAETTPNYSSNIAKTNNTTEEKNSLHK